MVDPSDSAKKDLISAFEAVEEDDDFLVAKESDFQHDEYTTEEDKYVFPSYCIRYCFQGLNVTEYSRSALSSGSPTGRIL